MKKAILIDGNSLIFRAFYATAHTNLMSTSKGVFTNAVFSFINMFEKIVESNPDYVFVAFDTDEKTHRHEEYSDYKAGRADFPAELGPQFAIVRKFLSLRGAKSYSFGGYEADDLLGTISKEFSENKIYCDLYSSDRDMLQLIDDYVSIQIVRKGVTDVEKFDFINLAKIYGLIPNQIIDLKALSGDKSDNIIGIPGIGDVTATKLIQKYNSVEELYSRIDESDKYYEKIITHKEQVLKNKRLVTIDRNVLLDFIFSDCVFKNKKDKELNDFFLEYELRYFVKEEFTEKQDVNYFIIINEKQLEDIIQDNLNIYFEFDKDNYHKSSCIGVGISTKNENYFLEFDLLLKSKKFISYLESKCPKSVYNYKSVYAFLFYKNIILNGVNFDYLIASYLLNTNKTTTNLSEIAINNNVNYVENDIVVYGKKEIKIIPGIKLLSKHIASKVYFLSQFKQPSLDKLTLENLDLLFNTIELPLSRILAKMECEGVRVSLEILEEIREKLEIDIKNIENEIYKYISNKVNLNSPKQMGVALFETLGIKYPKKLKEGETYSTAVDILEAIKNVHPVVSTLLDYRKITKLFNTYVETMPDYVFSDGKIHNIYDSTLTSTGRLSSHSPNIQNIPIRDEIGRDIRRVFLAGDGYNFVGCDYSQIELRLLAHIASVSNLKKAFVNELDIHTETAKQIFNIEVVSKEERRRAKAVNFGIIYGMSAYGLSNDISVSVKASNEYIESYFKVYPEIKSYMNKTIEECKKSGYVKTIYGRRRYLPNINASNNTVKLMNERMAINAPIQGSAADLIKKAMIDLDNYLTTNNLKSKLLIQIHDELILLVPNSELELMKEVLPRIMSNACELSVPLTVSLDVGTDWYQLK